MSCDAYTMLKLQAYEAAVKADLAATQVVHVPLEEYEIGSERYERLWLAMQGSQRFSSPEDLRFNV